MNLNQIVGAARLFLPENSPWLERIDKAAEIAKTFPASRDGLTQLMEQHGKNKKDLQEAIKALNSPAVQNTLGRVPGLSDTLNGVAGELMKEGGMPEATTGGNGGNTGSAVPKNLMERLNRLR